MISLGGEWLISSESPILCRAFRYQPADVVVVHISIFISILKPGHKKQTTAVLKKEEWILFVFRRLVLYSLVYVFKENTILCIEYSILRKIPHLL